METALRSSLNKENREELRAFSFTLAKSLNAQSSQEEVLNTISSIAHSINREINELAELDPNESPVSSELMRLYKNPITSQKLKNLSEDMQKIADFVSSNNATECLKPLKAIAP